MQDELQLHNDYCGIYYLQYIFGNKRRCQFSLYSIQSDPELSTAHTQRYGLTGENKHLVMVILCACLSYTQEKFMHKPPKEALTMRVLTGLLAAHFI